MLYFFKNYWFIIRGLIKRHYTEYYLHTRLIIPLNLYLFEALQKGNNSL